MSRIAFDGLLESLDAPRGGILYVQSSSDWLAKAGFAVSDVIAGLLDWVGPQGTLLVPTYPCRTTHLDYLQTHPTYDVRRTAAGIGLIPEFIRRRPGAHRSLDPDFSIAGEGPAAAELTTTDLDDGDPFGRSSTYERMIAAGASLLGLGVSLNTNSFIHVIDSRFKDAYPRSPYAESYAATVIDREGRHHLVTRRALAREFQQRTKPSAIAAANAEDRAMFQQSSINGAMFFRWNLAQWAGWCHAHAEARSAAGQWPCWLSELAS